MKKIVSYALPVLVAIALFWGYSRRSESENGSAGSASGRGIPSTGSTVPKGGGSDDPVVIRINDETITRSEFQQAFESMPENVRASMENPAGFKSVADELVRMRLLVQEARKRGLDKVPAVERAIALNSNNILASAALKAMVDEQSGSNLRDLYEKNIEQFSIVEARQIVVAYDGARTAPRSGKALSKDEAVARAGAIVARLRAGEEFASVAKKDSDDASASQGGKIGKLTRANLPPELGDPLFALKVGEISDPVVSALGVHIFQVTNREVRPFEDVEPALRNQGEQLRAREIMGGLVKGAKVELDPKFFGKKDSNE